MEKNSTQNTITVISVIVALVAVLYAVYATTAKNMMAMQDETVVSYSEGDKNPVVLTVNGHDVTRSEILDNFAGSSSALPQGADVEKIFPLLQEQYVVGKLLTSAAQASGINGTTPEVARKIEDAREQALRAVYIDQLTQTSVTDADVEQAYDDIVGNAPAVMERQASHILVKTEDEAKDIIVQLKNGADFATLAKEKSTGPTGVNGGDLGYFVEGDMVPAFSDAAYAMEIGAYSQQPVQTQFGYHVIYVANERELAKPTFDAMQEQLKQQLTQAVIRERLEELREKATIVVYDFDGNAIAPVEVETMTDEDAAMDVDDTPEATEVTETPVVEEAPAAADDTATEPTTH